MNPKSEPGPSNAPSLHRRHPLTAVFISPAEPRLRAGWRLTLQIILQLVLSACAGIALLAGWRSAFEAGSSALSGGQIMLMEIGEFFAITTSDRARQARPGPPHILELGIAAAMASGAGLRERDWQ